MSTQMLVVTKKELVSCILFRSRSSLRVTNLILSIRTFDCVGKCNRKGVKLLFCLFGIAMSCTWNVVQKCLQMPQSDLDGRDERLEVL